MSTVSLSTLLTEGLRTDGSALSSHDKAVSVWTRISERASELVTAKAGDLDRDLGKVVSESYGEKPLPKGWATLLVSFGKFFILAAPVKEARFDALQVWRKIVAKGDSNVVDALIATATTQNAAWTALCAKPVTDAAKPTDLAKATAVAKVFPRTVSNLSVFFMVPRSEWTTEMLMVSKQMEVFCEQVAKHS